MATGLVSIRPIALAALVALGMYSPAASAAFQNGPYLQHVQETSVLLMWETDADSTATVQYGTSQAYGQQLTVSEQNTLHRVMLEGLKSDTPYYYAVTESSGTTRTGHFTTAPPAGRPFTFAAYGDNRSNPDSHRVVASAILQHAPRLVVTTGDYVENAGALREWHDQFFVPAGDLLANTPLLPAIGNHDSEVGHPGSPVMDYFPLPGEQNYYAWDYGDIHFVVVDSNLRFGPASPQYRWLEQDLAATTRSVVIVLHHYPVYSSGNHGSTPGMDKSLRTLYEKYHVTAVLNGHDHMYERSVRNGIHYFVLGGGGADLYSPEDNPNAYAVYSEKTHNFGMFSWDGTALNMTAFRPDGSVIETVPLYGPGAPVRVAASQKPSSLEEGEAEDTAETAGCGIKGQGGMVAGGASLSLLALASLTVMRRRKR